MRSKHHSCKTLSLQCNNLFSIEKNLCMPRIQNRGFIKN